MGDYIEFVSQIPVGHVCTYDFDKYLKAIEKAKNDLTPRQREIFILNKECGIPVGQIAEKLGIQAQVVSNQLCTALKIVKNSILW